MFVDFWVILLLDFSFLKCNFNVSYKNSKFKCILFCSALTEKDAIGLKLLKLVELKRVDPDVVAVRSLHNFIRTVSSSKRRKSHEQEKLGETWL